MGDNKILAKVVITFESEALQKLHAFDIHTSADLLKLCGEKLLERVDNNLALHDEYLDFTNTTCSLDIDWVVKE